MKNPHSASFHQGPLSSKTSPSKHQTPSPAPDDIVLGSVDLQTIRENVSRLHVTQPPNSSSSSSNHPGHGGSVGGTQDPTSMSVSSLAGGDFTEDSHNSLSEVQREDNQNVGKVASGLISPQSQPSLSSLPDVVQQYNNEHGQAVRSGGDPAHDMSPAGSLNGDTSDKKLEEQTAGLKGASVTLTQLQDPQTFTLGSPDEKKKNKITKANFTQAQGALHAGMTAQDPSDPLGSLDPLWSLAKK